MKSTTFGDARPLDGDDADDDAESDVRDDGEAEASSLEVESMEDEEDCE